MDVATASVPAGLLVQRWFHLTVFSPSSMLKAMVTSSLFPRLRSCADAAGVLCVACAQRVAVRFVRSATGATCVGRPQAEHQAHGPLCGVVRGGTVHCGGEAAFPPHCHNAHADAEDHFQSLREYDAFLHYRGHIIGSALRTSTFVLHSEHGLFGDSCKDAYQHRT